LLVTGKLFKKRTETTPFKYSRSSDLPIIIIFNASQKRNGSMEFRSTALAEQRIFSQVVKEYINEGYTIGVWGWWQAPEISFLSGGLRFINIEKNNNYLEKNDILVIYTKLHEQLEPKSANELINKLGSPIYISQNYNYYLYTPNLDKPEPKR